MYVCVCTRTSPRVRAGVRAFAACGVHAGVRAMIHVHAGTSALARQSFRTEQLNKVPVRMYVSQKIFYPLSPPPQV